MSRSTNINHVLGSYEFIHIKFDYMFNLISLLNTWKSSRIVSLSAKRCRIHRYSFLSFAGPPVIHFQLDCGGWRGECGGLAPPPPVNMLDESLEHRPQHRFRLRRSGSSLLLESWDPGRVDHHAWKRWHNWHSTWILARHSTLYHTSVCSWSWGLHSQQQAPGLCGSISHRAEAVRNHKWYKREVGWGQKQYTA